MRVEREQCECRALSRQGERGPLGVFNSPPGSGRNNRPCDIFTYRTGHQLITINHSPTVQRAPGVPPHNLKHGSTPLNGPSH